ncbi:MAG: HlyD family type I secretion periplasmic adaptor subunit, partial [Gammaproteobacteria bacterium]|nr:HlyD family type I secretion periplasmic adaptor subunit [Gammaproteobacteria bacterium]
MTKNKNIKLKDEDLHFVQSISVAMLEQTPKKSRTLMYTVFILFIVMIIWSLVTEVDEITRGEGKVIPSKK